jgi:hypothetical protein
MDVAERPSAVGAARVRPVESRRAGRHVAEIASVEVIMIMAAVGLGVGHVGVRARGQGRRHVRVDDRRCHVRRRRAASLGGHLRTMLGSS